MRPKDYKPRRAKVGEVYACYIRKLKKYCLYQILSVDRSFISYAGIDYLSEKLPNADDVKGLPIYRRNEYVHCNSPEKSIIQNNPVPHNYVYICTMDLITEPPYGVYSGGWPDGNEYITRERWRAFGKAGEDYRRNLSRGDIVVLQGTECRKYTDHLDDRLYQLFDENDPFDQFTNIYRGDVTGYSDKLMKILCQMPLMTKLDLKAPGHPVIDLSRTHLNSLTIDVTGVKKLILPPEPDIVKLRGEISEDLTIDDSYCRQDMDALFIKMSDTHLTRFGMKKIKTDRLIVSNISELDLKKITAYYPEIYSLDLDGKPGNVKNFKALGSLERLEKIYCHDVFGFTVGDAAALNDLPCLYEIDLDSVPKDAGEYLKKQWKGRLDYLSVRCLRDEGWLRDNLNNPLRHWDGSEFVPAAAYKKAVKCYKDTKKKLLSAESREQAEDTVRQYALCFNELNAKYNMFIETEERDDIFEALEQLINECIDHESIGITVHEAWEIMDSIRIDW